MCACEGRIKCMRHSNEEWQAREEGQQALARMRARREQRESVERQLAALSHEGTSLRDFETQVRGGHNGMAL